MLSKKTQYAFNTFKEIVINESPVLDIDQSGNVPDY